MICNVCQAVLTAEAPSINTGSRLEPTSLHHRTCQSLKHSVHLGCYVCNTFWATLKPRQQDIILSLADSSQDRANDETGDSVDGATEDPVESFITVAAVDDGSIYGRPGSYQLSIGFEPRGMFPPDLIVGLGYWRAIFLLQPRDGSGLLYTGKKLPRSTKSAAAFSLARKWITTCTTDHQQCKRRIRKPGSYPTRLLDCGPSDSPEICRLIETATTDIDGPYMTLSHCWGQADCMNLTTENRAQLLNQVPFTLLPKLHRDAVYVTRTLGVRYLWIDALCIIQRGDKSKDWKHEVALMDKVYANSFCNISPTDAPDSHHSMFCLRDPDLLYPQTVDLSVDGTISPYVLADSGFWDTEVTQTRLNKRAWVLQERLLSPRVLHFSRGQMLWECLETDASDHYPNGVPAALMPSYSLFKDFGAGRDVAADKAGEPSITAYRAWSEITRAYSACDITFPAEKLVALSGVAKTMAKVLQDDYVAGMWRRYLERELLWSVVSPRVDKIADPTGYRAPSWSWVAVYGEVTPGWIAVKASDMLIEVRHVELDYASDDTTGLLIGGWLRLRGVLKQLELVRHTSSPLEQDWIMSVNGVRVSVTSESIGGEQQPHITPDTSYEDLDERAAGGSLYGMPGRAREGDDGSINLLILHLEDRKRAVFRRVGFARGWGKDVKEKILARSEEECGFPCEEYTDGLHSIHII